jgi:hypothetical protein
MEAILPVHVIRVHFDLSDLPDHPVHVTVFSGEDAGVLELDSMAEAYTVFGHNRIIWILQKDVLMVLLDSGLHEMANLPSVYLTTFAGHAAHPCSHQSQVILQMLKEKGNLPRQDVHRDEVADKHAAKGKKGDRDGFFCS